MLRPDPIGDVPEETARVARAAFRRGNLYLRLRDELGVVYTDADFAELFSALGRPVVTPWRLALVTVVQFLETLPDRQAADAVRARIDLKYLLGLDLTDPGFDYSVLSEFRSRLLTAGKEHVLLDRLLDHLRGKGLLKERGKQRTDSTHVLGAVRRLTRLELLSETFRAALNELATVDPAWLSPRLHDRLVKLYARRIEEHRLPKTDAAREKYAAQVGLDGFDLLDALDEPGSEHLRELPKVVVLRLVWSQQFDVDDQGVVKWKDVSSVPPAIQRPASPYDPETLFSSKGSMDWVGYKVHLTETCEADLPEVITNVVVADAPEPDAIALSGIHDDLKAKNQLPAQHFVDGAYISAELLIESRRDFGLDLIGPAKRGTSWQERTPGAFTHRDFRIDWDRKEVKCPQGYLNRTWLETTNAEGAPIVHVEFRRRTCERCSVRERCTRAEPTKAGRTLMFKRKEGLAALHERRDLEDGADWTSLYSIRSGIEATIAQTTGRFELRRARYWGQAKVLLQAIGTAVAVNLSRFDAWLEERPRAKTRTARFARIALQA